MIRLFILCFLLSESTVHLFAQSLYIPRNVQQAYRNETRSPDGRPGKKYWQNFGRYDIVVSAMPPDRTIRGTERISYYNNSPDTIKNPVIRLILNIHKPGALRYQEASQAYLTSGIHIDSFAVNGKNTAWKDPAGHYTWQNFQLTKPLIPHDSLQLFFSWNYEVSLESGREGMIDSSTFFLAYFYPRVAVFDDCNGWDRLDFTDQQEFYNDFNDYTLTVNAPRNYIVWATGTLLNPNEVLQPSAAKKLIESMSADSIIHIANLHDLTSNNITAQNALNTWKWKAGNITDIALGLSDHYLWDASSVVVDDLSHRRASVQSAYNDKAADFHQMAEFGRHALGWLSHNWPGIPYPFEKSTIFQGFADMEYPMMVNDASNPSPIFSRFVAEHEIAHSYFPFYMGINESRYAFMDEGWATTFELLIGRSDLGVQRAEDFYKQFRVQGWIKDPASEEDLPIITPANVLRGESYGNNAYGKPSLGYLAIKDLLGDELFKKCLQEYMNRWHGKHPIPWDFFNSFNNVSGQNLNWFWSNWFFSNYYIDLGIDQVQTTKTGYLVSISNIGGLAIPLDVQINYVDGQVENLHQTPAIWIADPKMAKINLGSTRKIQSLQLKTGIFMDANESNNNWKANDSK